MTQQQKLNSIQGYLFYTERKDIPSLKFVTLRGTSTDFQHTFDVP